MLALFLFHIFPTCLAVGLDLNFYESTIPVMSSNQTMDHDKEAGMSLASGSALNGLDIDNLSGLSICLRFNLRRLINESGWLVEWQSPDMDWSLFKVAVGYRKSTVAFGNNDTFGSMPSWIIRVQGEEGFNIWSTNKWHHLCFSFRASDKKVTFIKVTTDPDPDPVGTNHICV